METSLQAAVHAGCFFFFFSLGWDRFSLTRLQDWNSVIIKRVDMQPYAEVDVITLALNELLLHMNLNQFYTLHLTHIGMPITEDVWKSFSQVPCVSSSVLGPSQPSYISISHSFFSQLWTPLTRSTVTVTFTPTSLSLLHPVTPLGGGISPLSCMDPPATVFYL